MSDNIIIAGLPLTPNLGDVAIFECTKSYIENNVIKNKDVIIHNIDLTTATYMGEKFRKWEIIEERLKEKLDEVMSHNTKAVIFAGGGLIKYIYQEYLPNAVGLIIERADSLNIPVMLSAVGVEGYEEDNNCCQRIKENLNRGCVKIITTRDDIEKLNSCFVTNSNIITARVADPVCSLQKMYKPAKKQEGIIGLNVTRKYLFLDNEIDLDEEQLLKLWGGIYTELTKSGKKCKIFTNGLVFDQEFGDSLCDFLQIDKSEHLVSRPSSVEELVETISSFEGIVGTRLHCAIFAYAYGVPIVELVWNVKQTMFGNIIGKPERFISPEDFEPAHIVSSLLEAIENDRQKGITTSEDFRKTTYDKIQEFFENFVEIE